MNEPDPTNPDPVAYYLAAIKKAAAHTLTKLTGAEPENHQTPIPSDINT